MPRRPISGITPEERALWERVTATITPLAREVAVPTVAAQTAPVVEEPAKAVRKVKGRVPPPRQPVAPAATPSTPMSRDTLDASWDKRLSRGLISPESTIDLHGHTLSSAYAVLDDGLARAVRRGDRVLLLITGNPPRPESERPHARGAIRAAVGDWLAASRHADNIAAIRGAHPRHGGRGALYIILRRMRNY